MADFIQYKGTSVRGLTKEIEIPVPWGKIAGKVYGDPSNAPVLCIHGWLDNCNTFDKLIPLLPTHKFYLLIDLPGHGLSTKIPLGMFYTTFDSVALIERIANYYGWKSFSLLSHSLGGNISAIYAGTFPEKVDKLIILDTAGVYPISEKRVVKRLRSSIKQYQRFEKAEKPPRNYTYSEAKARLFEANNSLTEDAADIILERGTTKLGNGNYIFARDLRVNYRQPVSIYSISGLEFLSRIEAETMHILAEDGFKTSLDPDKVEVYHKYMQDGFNSCEYYRHIEVKGRHHVHLCHPNRIAGHVTAMLERPPRSGLDKHERNSKL